MVEIGACLTGNLVTNVCLLVIPTPELKGPKEHKHAAEGLLWQLIIWQQLNGIPSGSAMIVVIFKWLHLFSDRWPAEEQRAWTERLSSVAWQKHTEPKEPVDSFSRPLTCQSIPSPYATKPKQPYARPREPTRVLLIAISTRLLLRCSRCDSNRKDWAACAPFRSYWRHSWTFSII